ncbi:MAG TPA: alanyl-tRNA editing protein, partial [Kofleriaceae bacterium]|nr:alanyl-tRNA editing protein [Kofleriaceae bacterium]
MATLRLYLDDPLLLGFRATVAGHGNWDGKPALLLDRSAFYPEGGGQLGDRGRIGTATITDVQVDDAGVVHHLYEGEPPPAGTEVDATIDAGRRRLHMALHTGQHMLSRALLDVAAAETVSARLGESGCTIDLGVAAIDDPRVAEAEELANAVIDGDVAIRAWVPAPGELAALPLRRTPKVDRDIRVVAIGEFDVSPCGGTHCTGSAQVGLIRVTGLERYKGMMRLRFDAGRRARDGLWREAAALAGLGRDYTCGPLDV